MPRTCNTPQEAEDDFYDALEEGDLSRLLSVWSAATATSSIATGGLNSHHNIVVDVHIAFAIHHSPDYLM